MTDERAVCGAKNNADWYEAMFSAQGLRYHRKEHAFVAQDSPPPYYSEMTVLSPDQIEAVISELGMLAERFAGVMGLKDSFCQLDLTKNGFETLFEANWIWRSSFITEMPIGWEIVNNATDLLLWENSWKSNGSPAEIRVFPDSLLTRGDVFFLGRRAKGRFDAGCIANMSSNCVGLSNVYAEEESQRSYSQAADAVSALGGDLPVVGYESGNALIFAKNANFDLVGPLRILVTRHAEF